MDLMKTEYEFLDLSDVKGAELKGLQCALFNEKTQVSATTINGYTENSTEVCCGVVSNKVVMSAEVVGGELGPRGPVAPPPGPPPYAPPPLPYAPPHQQWAPPPNVYVSQVTANVNVHGYMGQYYQPQQYPPATRPPRRDRRIKRAASPPPPPQQPPPPYYVQYPAYYAAQAQGAPLYQLPVYQPSIMYPPYYPTYYPEYPPEDEPKPEEYEPGVEHEPGPEYYPTYYPPPEPPLEYIPHYLPPPPPATHHVAPTHQFNVHAKNFVLPNHMNQAQNQQQNQQQNQTHNQVQKQHMSSEKPQEHKITPTASASASVESLPIKDLKITNKGQVSPKQPSTPDGNNQTKTSPVMSEKSSPTPTKIETKPGWSPETKTPDVSVNNVMQPVKTFPATPVVVSSSSPSANKIPQQVNKISKGPTAPFSSNKPAVKPTTQIGVTVQAPVTTPKPPFSNRQRKEPSSRSPPSEPASVSGPAKAPFAPARRPVSPPPPAPWEFPPPPAPRNRPAAPAAVTPTPPPAAPGKSWASLFQKPTVPVSTAQEASSPPPAPRPVAKVPPYDASPVVAPEPPVAQYAVKAAVPSPAPAPAPVSNEKEPVSIPPPQPSPFADDPNSYRMGEFLSKYQLDNRPVSLLPRGLTNRSNYCYVNAILQALIACPPLYNMLKALPYQTRRGKSSTPVIDAMVELCYEFTVVGGRGGRSAALPVQAGAALDGAAGLRVLRALTFPGAAEGRQEDAEEFLGCLLNGLNDEMLELMKLVEPEECKESQVNGVAQQEPPPLEEDDDDDEWKVMGPRNKGAIERRWAAGRTPLSDIFRGRTRCRLHRAAAHDVTDAVQPFFTLQLDIERANNVKDALELLAGKDTLEGVTDAWQQLSLEQLPVVLLLHLKCFQLDAEGHTAKIVKNIDFPIDLKIDPKIMSSKAKYSTKQRLYKLFAVVYHEGVEAVKGHYLTDTYHGMAGWIRYDDSTVTLVNDAQVLKPKPPRMPYILMYRRQDTLPTPHRPVPKTD